MAQSSSQPLSVGNVVTTAFQLYKNRFQPYFLLAFKAYFWLLVPVYGWAKFSAISALISRLVYGELVNQPETIKDGTRYVNSKLWQFFLAGIILGLIVVGAYIVFTIAVVIVGVVVGFVGAQLNNFATIAIAGVLGAIAFIAFLIGFFLLFVRFFVFELPLAIEDNMDASSTISRSWELTKGFVGRILLISFVAFLITFPLFALVQLVSFALRSILVTSNGEPNPVLALLFFTLTLCLSFSSGAVQLPFWQAIKAVVYYDLRTRKEGLGLNLRDRNI